ncbi:SusC/RagA family TonB-linked outer membrane protein [Draconibacterium mangrovi]|uniref:SusC/RagA family TonB-linked outer membrane protein n=1 Tax=Draconibacterium mangrovi TaxID=2697469 RepID=UPI0013D5B8A6|nr:TonB-dependent receptor [Draconibacterium mangrovi]
MKKKSINTFLRCREVKKVLLIMKLTTIFILIGLMQVSATVYSQVTKFNFNVENKQIIDVLKEIEETSNFRFFYIREQIDVERRVSIESHNATIEALLNEIFSEEDIYYKILDDDLVILSPQKKRIENSSEKRVTQQNTIVGTVKDVNGQPLPGVTIVVKGTTLGTVSDNEGGYSISNVANNSILVFSFVGMKSQEIEITGRNVINVILEEESFVIGDVITVGYKTQKRTTMTGSVSVASGEELSSAPVSTVTGALAGRMAGVTMRSTNGQPGYDDPTIYIRGVSTTGNQAPLVVVDGVPRSNMRQIDPNAIESVTILKDASSVAPYGIGGANGVILITTKQGIKSAPKLTLNSYYGIQTPTYTPNVLNAVDYMKLRNEALLNENPGTTELDFDQEIIDNYANLHAQDPDVYPDDDPYSLANFNTPIQNHNLQLEGGSDYITYFASLGYLQQDGLFDQVNYNRISYTLNTKSKVTNSTSVIFNIIGAVEKYNDLDVQTSSASVFRDLYKLVPTVPLYYSNGLWTEYGGSSPVGAVNSGGYSVNNQYTILGTLGVEQELSFIKGLKFSGKISWDIRNSFEKGWHIPFKYWTLDTSTDPYTFDEQINTHWGPYTYLNQEDTRRLFKTYQGVLNYNNTFGKHEVSGLLVAEARETETSTLGARRDQFNVNVDEMSMGPSDRSYFDNSGMSFESKQLGFVYQLGYVFDQKYIIEATGRYDGHYYFAPGKRWGFFPAFSGSWRISEEKFMDNIDFVSNLKLRGSWGKSGNLAGSAYQYLSGYLLEGNRYALGSGSMLQSVRQTQEANPNITWEVSKKSNIGIEANLWNSLLSIELDYFHENRSGMLLPPNVTVPLEYGISLADENAGKMENRGIDVVLGSRYKFDNGLSLNIQGNLSYSHNKMIEVFETNATYNNPNRRRTGRPYGTQFGYESLGLFSLEDDVNGDGIINGEDGYDITQFGTLRPGDIIYKDVNGDKVIDANDEVEIGYPQYPLLIYGLNLGTEWKGFDLNLFFQGAGMFSISTQDFHTVPFLNNNSNVDYEYFENRWTPDNQNADYPRASPSSNPNNHGQSTDFWQRDVNYLRLKTVILGYTLPEKFTQNVGIDNVRVYASAENLLTISNLKWLDPELGSATEYPNMKSINLGVKVTF